MIRYALGLIAHDAKKGDMVQWVGVHHASLRDRKLVATASTGERILNSHPELALDRLKSGPLGGDQEMGALIAGSRLDALVFFIDPLSPLPHDVDVKALTRLAVLYNIPLACNRATADHLLSHSRV